MEPWYSGAVADAVREAKSRRALLIVYIYDESEQSQYVNGLWLNTWTKITDLSNIVALRLDKDSQACKQFQMIYKVQTYPTIYLINGQNGQVVKMIDQQLENSEKLEEIIQESLNVVQPKPVVTDAAASAAAPPPPVAATPIQSTKTVDEKVAEARARLKTLQDKREEEVQEKERQDEIERRRLGQQMLLDKQKKDEEAIRKQAEDIRRDKLEQQKLQEKLKAQIQQDREEKRRKYEQEQTASTVQQTKPKPSPTPVETPKINYNRTRLQFRLTDGSFFTEDFSPDARMNEVYAYLQQTLPADQYRNGSYVLRTTHTRVTLPRDNPNTLKDLDLVPSAVLLVISRGNATAPSTNLVPANIFQSFQLMFAWFMMQINFIYQFLARTLFGNRNPPREQTRPSTRPPNSNTNEQRRTPSTKSGENFKTDSTEKSTIRRFHNTQDDSDDEDRRTWNGNSTQQM